MKNLIVIAASSLCLAGCMGGDPPPTVGQSAPGTEATDAAMNTPEMQAKLNARNATRADAASQAGKVPRH